MTSRTTALVSGAVLTISCGAAAVDRTPPIETPAAFAGSGAAAIPERWWTAFGDPQLDALVDEALRSNLDLAAVWERLRAARAVVDRESASLLPAVNAEADAEVQVPGATETLWLGLTAGYEIDLWGRIDSAVDAERYRARASLADYRTAALSLSAEVVRTWCLMIEARGQLELLADQIEGSEQVLELLENRFGSGQIRAVDILRQRQLIEATRELQLVARTQLAVSRHQLAVLLGRPPRAPIAASRAELPELPPLPATGVPAELVRRRPDVRRAYLEVAAADRDLAAAIADRYPRLSLSASAGTRGRASELFEGWIATLAANLLAPLFDGGERAAEVDRARAVKRQRLHEYGQRALEAFREVEDALVRERDQLARLDSLDVQLELAEKTYRQLRIEYFNGLSNYIDVLTALTEEQQLQRERLAAERTLLELRIAVYRALAGGFETERERS